MEYCVSGLETPPTSDKYSIIIPYIAEFVKVFLMIRKVLDQTIGRLTVFAPESSAPLLQAAVLKNKTQS